MRAKHQMERGYLLDLEARLVAGSFAIGVFAPIACGSESSDTNTRAGEATGPAAVVSLSTSDFFAGPAKLVAVARDRAGNESTASIDVIVE